MSVVCGRRSEVRGSFSLPKRVCASLDKNLARQKKTPRQEQTAASHEETASKDEFSRQLGTFTGSQGLPVGVKGFRFHMTHVPLLLRACKTCRIFQFTATSS